MNDQQILTLIAATPGIRATLLAEKLNTPLVDVSASLRSLVDVGDLVRRTNFENGTERKYQVYELSEQFRRSREGQKIFSTLAGAPQVEVVKPEVSVATPQLIPTKIVPASPSPFSKLETEPAPQVVAGSKVDRALNWIRANGPATDDQLRDVMDIGRRPPAAYLTSALKGGRVVRDGDRWKLGAGKPAPKPQPLVHDQGSVVRVDNVIVATRDCTPVPAEVKAVLTEMAAATGAGLLKPEPEPAVRVAAAPPKEYRCGVWSDGMVTIANNGGTVRITQAALAEIAEFAAKWRAA